MPSKPSEVLLDVNVLVAAVFADDVMQRAAFLAEGYSSGQR
jgi:hypothetical protein